MGVGGACPLARGDRLFLGDIHSATLPADAAVGQRSVTSTRPSPTVSIGAHLRAIHHVHMISRVYPDAGAVGRGRLGRCPVPASSADESTFELLEQMRIIPLLYDVDGDVVEFADLDDVLSRNPRA